MKLVILDRDGVINEDSDAFIKSPEEWRPVAGSLDAIARLNRAGYRVLVATNQSGIARGLYDLETLHAIHQKMLRALDEAGGAIDGIYFCPHGPDDNCDCRKPLPGLFEQIRKRVHAELTQVPAIGDSVRDLQAAEAAGALPILVRTGKGRKTEAALAPEAGIAVYDDLAEAVDALLENEEAGNDSP